MENQNSSDEIGVIVLRSDGQPLHINKEAAKALNGCPPAAIQDPTFSARPAFFRTGTGVYRVRTFPVTLGGKFVEEKRVPLPPGGPLLGSLKLNLPQGAPVKIILLEPLPSRWSLKPMLGRFGFSPRQKEVVLWVMRGLSNCEIGKRLFITEQTVKDHLHDIFKKVHVHRRCELIAKVLGLQP